jgi:hypothetical protein
LQKRLQVSIKFDDKWVLCRLFRQKYGRNNMNNVSTLIGGIIFGSIGLGFFVYGKKQKVIIPILSGIGLMVFPYFVSNIYIMVLSGIVLVALPYFIRL